MYMKTILSDWSLIILFSLTTLFPLSAQNSYEKGWQALDEARLFDAIDLFEKASKEKDKQEESLIALTLLYSQLQRHELATERFLKYYETAEDPTPTLYALWFQEGVFGGGLPMEGHQIRLLEKVPDDPRISGKLEAAARYWLGTHYLFANRAKAARKQYEKVGEISDWTVTGPFDNVVNGGFDKDFGILSRPDSEASFTSKYGAPVGWFNPAFDPIDNYFSKDKHFFSYNSLVYAQTFLEAPEQQEVLLKFGYSGSLKVWLNDQLIYGDPRLRITEMDYFQFRCTLQKGYNRLLVQLGDYQQPDANFILRLTDLKHKPLELEQSMNMRSYPKEALPFERIPFFAEEALQQKARNNPDDPIYQLLLVEAFFRAWKLDQSETILKKALTERPDNFFFLRNMILQCKKTENPTDQNRYYELYKEKYPDDPDILDNEIEELSEQGEKEKVRELTDTYLSRYPDEYQELRLRLLIAVMEEDIETALQLAEDMYEKYPDNYNAVSAKYDLEKSYYSRPEKANEVLEKFMESAYNFSFLEELLANYVNAGDLEKGIRLLENSLELTGFDIETNRKLINILSRQQKFMEAVTVCEKIIANCPSDYRTLGDLALLHHFMGNRDVALSYLEESLRFFPFSWDNNERIREMKEIPRGIDLIPEVDPLEIIRDYEANFVSGRKKSYDGVYENRSLIIFKSKATGIVHQYIIRMNDESAIEEWQQLNFSPGYHRNILINEVKTIKQNGEKIDAERNNGSVVFTNLEVGDYIYVWYTDKQVNGGKSSVFISDRFTFSSFYPMYRIEYNLFAENGLKIRDTLLNSDLQAERAEKEGFQHSRWAFTGPEVIKEEPFTIPFNDIARSLHISLDYSWRDIVQWYSDLTTHQAEPDFTIYEILDQLFEKDRTYSQEEKAQIIYDFVCKNIQYSSIDFRQSGYVPQRASTVYHSRLGDCKDVSTLYASLARTAGLEVDLVLINTSENGHKDVLLPSLNFNHCIVKVYLPDGPLYLELTDPDLPFGYLTYFHKGAPILEIPAREIPENASLKYLKLNPGRESHVYRQSKVSVKKDLTLEVDARATLTGNRAALACKSYFYADSEDQKLYLQQTLSDFFTSTLTIGDFQIDHLQPLSDTARYHYSYTLSNELLKVGSFFSLKAPFTSVLAQKMIFEDEERLFDFEFNYYENTDRYEEEITLELDESLQFVETPSDIQLKWEGFTYELTFEQKDEHTLIIRRAYDPFIKNIKAEDFPAFKEYMLQVIEAENTYLVIK